MGSMCDCVSCKPAAKVNKPDKPKYMVWTGKQSPKIIEADGTQDAAEQFLARTVLGVGANVKVMPMRPVVVYKTRSSVTFKETII